jgi:hypothetical protein
VKRRGAAGLMLKFPKTAQKAGTSAPRGCSPTLGEAPDWLSTEAKSFKLVSDTNQDLLRFHHGPNTLYYPWQFFSWRAATGIFSHMQPTVAGPHRVLACEAKRLKGIQFYETIATPVSVI